MRKRPDDTHGATGRGRPAPGEGDRKFVMALGRGLSIFDAFCEGETWLSSGDVSLRVGLPRPTASRLLQSLAQDGYLVYAPRRRQYRLGAGVLALGFAAQDSASVVDTVRPHLRRLADAYNVHASLAGRDRLDAIQIEVCHSSTTLMTLRLEVGSHIPVAGTATGHALLAALPAAELADTMAQLSIRHAKHWGEISRRIEEGVAEHRMRGFTTSKGSWMTDINGVAVGLSAVPGWPVLALSCGAPARHLPRAKMEDIGQELRALAHALESDPFGLDMRRAGQIP